MQGLDPGLLRGVVQWGVIFVLGRGRTGFEDPGLLREIGRVLRWGVASLPYFFSRMACHGSDPVTKRCDTTGCADEAEGGFGAYVAAAGLLVMGRATLDPPPRPWLTSRDMGADGLADGLKPPPPMRPPDFLPASASEGHMKRIIAGRRITKMNTDLILVFGTGSAVSPAHSGVRAGW